jgi:D-glycero-D-manno-heptose 1,7-bisphosphate phosphatase
LKTLFVDRDGVINQDRPDYVKRWSQFVFLPRSLDAIRLLSLSGYRIIVVTNQSVINRELVTEKELAKIHDRMTAAVEDHGGRIDSVYYCPHVPEESCRCRKPEPGLIRRAQEDFGLDLRHTTMVGDSLKDMGCARRAGCGTVILVRTGHGRETERLFRKGDARPDHVADDLMGAARWLLDKDSVD